MNNNFIFNPNKNTKKEIDKEYYCLQDSSEFLDQYGNGCTKQETSDTLAKKIQKEDTVIYQIKLSSNSQLFNPFSKFDREKSYSFLDNVVRPTDKFTNVNKMVFDFYLKFLSTQNTTWLNKAERERI